MTDLFGATEPDGPEPDGPAPAPVVEVSDEAMALLGDRAVAFREHVNGLFYLFDDFSVRVVPGERGSTAITAHVGRGRAIIVIAAEPGSRTTLAASKMPRARTRASERLPSATRVRLILQACRARRRVCPGEGAWWRLYELVRRETRSETLGRALILGGWADTSDRDKFERFAEHLAAAATLPSLLARVEHRLDDLSASDWHTSPSVIPADLVSAYEQTTYRVGTGESAWTMRIDEPSKELGDVYVQRGVSSALFITAFNPWSEATSDADNDAAHARLRDDLVQRGKQFVEGAGGDDAGEWPQEKSYLALDVSFEEATEMGVAFRQNAVVWAGEDAIPRLVLLR